ncbi:class I SAM-dependent methyltransferase [Actinomycetospora chibensis]|uniref:Class I SAM-dependent methyltransferase n=1 Tax=Actinomycetospora chibensis TaxID=663606 RepID=A0ABV9RTA6_9PSEU|nr:class I SAM-dependent methyltransferase [Actinomycetospora chibensis]MDD7927061.1 class I SAM-dependent methyltransferase [Actinomycetospora chibensis]
MPVNPWLAVTGGTAGPGYAARFAELEREGQDLHGEARRVDALVREKLGRPGDVLDAGCGTGRVAIRLAQLGHRVVGVDLDASMLDEARASAPELDWRLVDLVELRLDRTVDAVVAAGNLWPLLTPGTHAEVVGGLARHLRPGGLLVAGFGLDGEHVPFTLPDGVGFPTLADYDAAAAAAGLELVTRSADWAGEEPYRDGGYVVSVHTREGHL